VDPRDYEGRLDPSLEALVPSNLRVIRIRAIPARWTRVVRLGDLGLRSFRGLLHACRGLLDAERFDCLFITVFPSYPALLGPLLKRRTRIPFVLDYQDPWVGSWGRTTGADANGAVDLKSRMSRAVAARLEPIAVRAADGITAVSVATFEAVRERIPEAKATPCVDIPLGGEVSDFEYLRSHPRESGVFDSGDGRFHICYVGTLLPLGLETLRSFLGALALLKVQEPDLFGKLRVHFVGTSNQTASSRARVIPEAVRVGVEEAVLETPERIDYLDALDVLIRSDAILLMGSSERHYTASKLYPALLARRPLLAIFHSDSSVVPMLESVRRPSVQIITYDDQTRPESRVEEIFAALRCLVKDPHAEVDGEDPGFADELSARSMAYRLARFLDFIVTARAS
jgi:glycosyltransferase involved in cell wall biosynthesis